MGRSIRKLVLVVTILVLGGAFFYYLYKPYPATVLPKPNGYDDFIAAGSLIVGEVGDAPDMEQAELQALISTNAESLRLVRLGLTKQCSAPTDLIVKDVAGRLSELPRLKRLAQLLSAEGRLALLEGRPADAALIYADTIRVGNEISRGGVLINRLVGVAVESIGYAGLVKALPPLDCQQLKPVITILQNLELSRVDWDKIMKDEDRFTRNVWRKRPNPLVMAVSWWQTLEVKKRSRQRHETAVTKTRLMLLELSIRCYVAEKGRIPKSLSELPNFQQLPSDPFTGQSFVYRAEETNWVLYSVGVDGIDDGGISVGRRVPGQVSKGDLLFNSP